MLSLLTFFGIPCRNLARVELRYFEGSGALTCFVFFVLLGFATYDFFSMEIAEIECEMEVAFERRFEITEFFGGTLSLLLVVYTDFIRGTFFSRCVFSVRLFLLGDD